MPPWAFDDYVEIDNMLKTPLKYKHDPTRVLFNFKTELNEPNEISDLYGGCLCRKEFIKYKAEMEAPMDTDYKISYVALDLNVYYSGPYIILEHENYGFLKRSDNAKTIKVYIGIDTEKVKLQAFCIGLKRLYYEVYKDIFNDKVNVISSFTDGTKTTVMFDDGTDVSCRLHEGDAYIPEAGFAICLCKKIFGSISNIHRMLEFCDYAKRRKKAKEEQRERRKLETQKRIEKEKRDFEKQVQDEILRLRIHQEALKRLGWDECEDI